MQAEEGTPWQLAAEKQARQTEARQTDRHCKTRVLDSTPGSAHLDVGARHVIQIFDNALRLPVYGHLGQSCAQQVSRTQLRWGLMLADTLTFVRDCRGILNHDEFGYTH